METSLLATPPGHTPDIMADDLVLPLQTTFHRQPPLRPRSTTTPRLGIFYEPVSRILGAVSTFHGGGGVGGGGTRAEARIPTVARKPHGAWRTRGRTLDPTSATRLPLCRSLRTLRGAIVGVRARRILRGPFVAGVAGPAISLAAVGRRFSA